MSDYNVLVEYDNDADATMASNVMQTLCEAYPGHPWHVRIAGGVAVIKHMRLSSKWGMVLHYEKIGARARLLKHGVLVAGGELLERSGLSRGAMNEQPVTVIEGISDKDRVH